MNSAPLTPPANDARRRHAALAAMAATVELGLASRQWPAVGIADGVALDRLLQASAAPPGRPLPAQDARQRQPER